MTNSKVIKIDKNELDKIQNDILKKSKKAVIDNQNSFKILKQTINIVLNEKIDIDQYLGISTSISKYLLKLIENTPGTFFYHLYKNIHPKIYGEAQTLRKYCEELSNSILELESYIFKIKE